MFIKSISIPITHKNNISNTHNRYGYIFHNNSLTTDVISFKGYKDLSTIISVAGQKNSQHAKQNIWLNI